MRTSAAFIVATLSWTTAVEGITYNTWKSQVFTVTEAQNALVSGDLADPDKDGVSNLLEYAMNGDPKTASPALMPRPVRAADGKLSMSFTRRREAPDLEYMVEVSNDLTTWGGGFSRVWTTDAVASASEMIMGVPQIIADQVVATSQLAPGANGRQFMRLRVVRSPHATLLNELTAGGKSPSTMLNGCLVPQGSYAGYISKYIYPPLTADRLLNAPANWYLASVGLYHFVETHPALVKAHLQRYLAYKLTDGTHRIKDPDIFSDNTQGIYPPWTLFQDQVADSDDAYAGTLLRLAAKYQRLYPADTWFADNKQALKDIAYFNIVTETKSREVDKVFVKVTDELPTFNGLVRNYQLATSSVNVGYLMDNVQAWAGLHEFADALERVEGNSNDVIYYRGWRDSILSAIYRILWDEENQAWRADDTAPLDEIANKYVLKPAGTAPFYSALHCQLFPEIHGMPDVSGSTVETQHKYNLAWKWVVGHMPPWEQSAAWPLADPFSHLEIAVVGAWKGESAQVSQFLGMARGRWLPGGTVVNGTVSEQIGFWQLLVGH